VNKLIECLLKSIGQSSLLKCPNVSFEIRAFSTYLGAIFLQSLYLPLQPLPSPKSKSFEQSKEMVFDRRLANVTDPVV